MADSLSLDALIEWFRVFRTAIAENATWLTELDSAIGDADHGTNMSRGTDAILTSFEAKPPTTVPALFKSVGMAMVSKVGGASGSLYGTFFLEMGKTVTSESALTAEELSTALNAGMAGVVNRGHAEVGDKTMIDALTPALAALATAISAGESLPSALTAASAAAHEGRDSTTPLVARKGRASYLGERSAGHLDPGSASATLLLDALVDAAAPEATA